VTNVLITIDTEIRPRLHERLVAWDRNVANSILGKVDAGVFGINWQMDRLEQHGLKGVFFVDPMPALVYGEAFLEKVVPPIVSRGHEVQLHLHTEWLQWAKCSPVARYLGAKISNFGISEQEVLVRLSAELLRRAGAPRPIAFRAGHLQANDHTLMALASAGIFWDSSFGPLYPSEPHQIGLPANTIGPVRHCGVIELPISGFFDRRNHIRPVQVCAVSKWEMEAALQHAALENHPTFVIMSHSFEMLSRDGLRPNLAIMKRFERMCMCIADNPRLHSAGFADLDPSIADGRSRPSLFSSNLIRTSGRLIEQAMGNLRYEYRLKPPWNYGASAL
jgi:hypothetical protein